MKNKKNYFGTRAALIASFLIPAFIFTYILIGGQVFPVGEFCYLRTDLYHQYCPFFVEFRNKLVDGSGLLYSHHVGLGVNFVALYAYYLASPLNWLVFIWPKDYVIEYITLLVILKVGLASLAFTYYLLKHQPEDENYYLDSDLEAEAEEEKEGQTDWDFGRGLPRHNFGICLFGCFYALSGFMAAYNWNIMWLDCIVLFPLIMLGLERLIQEKKGVLYAVTLGLCILTNYYISIMICMFLVVYFFVVYFLKENKSIKDFLRSGLQFGFYSILAGGSAAAVLLPEIFALQMTASGDFSFPKKFENYFSIFDMLARHLSNVRTEQGLDHWPNIYCGAAVFIFIVLYALSKRISAREKAVYFSLLFFLLVSFAVNYLNFIWHGFHYPNSLPARQSFIYIFLVLVMCYRAYQYLYEVRPALIVKAMWGSILLIILMQKLVTDNEAFHPLTFYGGIILVALYGGLLLKVRVHAWSRVVTIAVSVFLVMLELTINTAYTGVSTQNRTAYMAGISQTQSLLEEAAGTKNFFRVRKRSYRTKNDGAMEQYNTASLFSSMANADVTSFYKKLGLTGSTNAYSTDGATPLTDMLLGINYLVSDIAMDDGFLEYRGEQDGWHLYENPNVLPIGYIVPDIMEDGWNISGKDPIVNQDNLTALFDIEPVLELVNGTNETGSFSFTVEEEGSYYIHIGSSSVKSVEVLVDGEKTSYDNVDRGYLIPTGYLFEGSSVSVKGEGRLDGRAAIFRSENLKQIYDRLVANAFVVEKDKVGGVQTKTDRADIICGSIDAGENPGSLMFTIPYDESWTVTVDGKKAVTRKIFDTFLSVEVPAGKHEIELCFYPKGFKLGMIICVSSIVLFVLTAIAEVLYHKSRNKKYSV